MNWKKILEGTDDGIVADPETSVKDVCRPETGKWVKRKWRRKVEKNGEKG
jgi:hypothetical protein